MQIRSRDFHRLKKLYLKMATLFLVSLIFYHFNSVKGVYYIISVNCGRAKSRDNIIIIQKHQIDTTCQYMYLAKFQPSTAKVF